MKRGNLIGRINPRIKEHHQDVPGCKKLLMTCIFSLNRGEVHALMGENGAGKSTLIKTITGVHKQEKGEMFFEGEKVDLKSPKDAQKLGIACNISERYLLS